jgi:hypothetical protein
VVHIFKIEFQPPAPTQKLIEYNENVLAEMFYHCSEDKKLFYKFLKTLWQKSFAIFKPTFDCLHFLPFLILLTPLIRGFQVSILA